MFTFSVSQSRSTVTTEPKTDVEPTDVEHENVLYKYKGKNYKKGELKYLGKRKGKHTFKIIKSKRPLMIPSGNYIIPNIKDSLFSSLKKIKKIHNLDYTPEEDKIDVIRNNKFTIE